MTNPKLSPVTHLGWDFRSSLTVWLWEYYVRLLQIFFILWKSRLKWSCDNMSTVLTWSWHSTHSFSTRILLGKVMSSERFFYTLQLSTKSSSLLTRKLYWPSSGISSVTHVISPGTEKCLVCPYSYFEYKAINYHSPPPTHPTYIFQTSIWTWWQIGDGKKQATTHWALICQTVP